MIRERYRYVIGGLLFCAASINYMDRASIGIVAPMLEKDLHLSSSQMGVVFSGFFLGYTVFAFVGGLLADRFGPRRVLSWAMGIWSILCGLTGAAVGFVSLLVIRILFGFGEGPNLSTTNRTVINWFPRREVGAVVGTVLSGQMIGSAISGPLIAFIAVTFGWRGAFIFAASIGLLWLVLWRIFMTDWPSENRRVGEAEALLIDEERGTLSGDLQGEVTGALAKALLRPGPIGIGLGLFAVNYTLYVLISWLPIYFVDVQHVSVTVMGWLTAIPWVAGALGSILGGVVSDLIYKRLGHPLLARKVSAWLPLVLSAAFVIVISLTTSLFGAVLCITLALLFVSAAGQACWSLTHELVPRSQVGSVGGFVHLLGNVAGIVGPALTGVAIQRFGGFEVGFRLCASMDVLAAIALLLMVKRDRKSSVPLPEPRRI